MPSKYDIFAKIIEKSPCKIKDLGFKKSIYSHINNLVNSGWVKKTKEGILVPGKNKDTEKIFQIIKWSLKNNLDYNIWFSSNAILILDTLRDSIPKISPKKLSNNRSITEIIH